MFDMRTLNLQAFVVVLLLIFCYLGIGNLQSIAEGRLVTRGLMR